MISCNIIIDDTMMHTLIDLQVLNSQMAKFIIKYFKFIIKTQLLKQLLQQIKVLQWKPTSVTLFDQSEYKGPEVRPKK